MREGYEGLVRGNVDALDKSLPSKPEVQLDSPVAIPEVIENLRYGYGSLLKNGEGDTDNTISERQDGISRTLKGKYIVRVGWDDVRSWLSEVDLCKYIHSPPFFES